MKTLQIVLLALLLAVSMNTKSQVAVNTDGSTADASAMFEVKSDTAGMLIPRMTATQRDSISNPALGLMVFVTDDNSFYYFDNSAWMKVGSGASGWNLNGNVVYTDSMVGIGTENPYAMLEIVNNKKENGLEILNNYYNHNPLGISYGIYNRLSTNGNDTHIGVYSTLSGIGNGDHYGFYSCVTGTGTGKYYGNYSCIGANNNSNCYGDYISIIGNGTNFPLGSKYGIYDSITINTGGTHYGVYSVAEGSSHYAGYFKGRMYVSDKVGIGTTSPTTQIDVQSSTSTGCIFAENVDGTTIQANSFNSNGKSIQASSSGGMAIMAEAPGIGTVKLCSTVDTAAGIFYGNVYMMSGDVGIATNSPDKKLHIFEDVSGLTYPLKIENDNTAVDTSAVGILFSAGGGDDRGKGALVYKVTDSWNRGSFQFLQDNTAGYANPDTSDAVVTIDNDGNMGIGTTSPGSKFEVYSGSGLAVDICRGTDVLGGITFHEDGTTNAQWIFPFFRGWQSDNLIVRDDVAGLDVVTFEYGTGLVGFGVTNPAYKIDLPNSNAASGKGRAYAWVTYSDSRLKTDQKPIDYGIETIMQLNPKRYIQHQGSVKNGVLTLSEEEKGSETTIGFIAQELYKVVPEAAVPPKDENNDFWAVNYEKIIPVLTNAVQQQQQIIDQQNKKIDNLQKRLERLEKLIEKQ